MRAYRAISLRAKLRPPGGDSPVAMGFSLLHIQGQGDLCPRWMNQSDQKNPALYWHHPLLPDGGGD